MDKDDNSQGFGHAVGSRARQNENATINHPRAQGRIDEAGKFRCHCGARPITNEFHHISTHLSIKHNRNSSRVKKATRDPRICGTCNKRCNSFTSFVSHIRSAHGFRGSTNEMWRDWQSTDESAPIRVRVG
ncbi:hypothetical protein F5Y05DRAFT_422176 [Hypoxylon sp. FL0543]|nr:hypothetical protein F5Y05DRAFT_422176 [Hypoxylon sp. FL0543]